MVRLVTTDPLVLAQYGPVPIGDVVLEITINDEVIAHMDIYWHTITIDGVPVDIAWFDHLIVDPNYQGFGHGSALFATAEICAAREMEWAIGPFSSPDFPFLHRLGWFQPDATQDFLLFVCALTGQPQTWPSGTIVATPPSAE